jgi:hypothetical protein
VKNLGVPFSNKFVIGGVQRWSKRVERIRAKFASLVDVSISFPSTADLKQY